MQILSDLAKSLRRADIPLLQQKHTWEMIHEAVYT